MESCMLECADIHYNYNQLSINWNVNEFRCHLLYLEARILHFANHWLNFEAENRGIDGKGKVFVGNDPENPDLKSLIL